VPAPKISPECAAPEPGLDQALEEANPAGRPVDGKGLAPLPACMSATTTEVPAGSTVAGKYLTFVLSRESYGIPVAKIREIIRAVEITPVPQTPSHLRGVINLRGKIIPVIDLRLKFGLPGTETTERTCIVVVQVRSSGSNGTHLMGLMVDDVEEVINIAASEIEDTPDFGRQMDTSYLLGMAKIKGRVKALLDIDLAVGSANLALTAALAAA
jgi:purine-binding chemotaxis protein CheW